MKIFNVILLFLISSSLLANSKVTECPKVKEIEADIEAVVIKFDNNQRRTVLSFLESLHYFHFKKQPLNDSFSKRMLEQYLESLDGRKAYFLESDIQRFRSKYATELDTILLKKDLEPLKEMFELFRERIINRLSHSIALMNGDKKFQYDTDETVAIDPDLYQWSKSYSDNLRLWEKLITLQLVNLKLGGTEEQEAKQKLARRFKNQLVNIKRLDSNDVLAGYLNSIGKLYDPHSNYFSPVQSDNFAIGISLSLEGIGASLTVKDDVVEVASIVPGSPSEKSGELDIGDKIVGVAEGDLCDFIDIVGMPLREVVQYIRGKKNSLVRLEVVKADTSDISEKKIVSIIRDKINLEDGSAKKELIQITEKEETLSIGMVDLPSFYVDLKGQSSGDKNYRSITRDVKRLLLEMNDEVGDLDGILIDLRRNGGGSLAEVISLSDLFLAPGPIVQIKGARRGTRSQVQIARNAPIFDQPLVVLIDRFSASASEIFAGAIQDYKRGIIIGGQSFGKGTVQSIHNLPVGQAKITGSKFYRVSGGSTQLKGVIPDITLPHGIDKDKIGESSLDNALPWDTINELGFPKYNVDKSLVTLKAQYEKRLLKNPDLLFLKNIAAIDKQRTRIQYLSINLEQRSTDSETWDKKYLDVENLWRKKKGYPPKVVEKEIEQQAAIVTSDVTESSAVEPIKSSGQQQEIIATSDASASESSEEEEIEIPDIALEEATRVLRDLIAANKLGKGNEKNLIQ